MWSRTSSTRGLVLGARQAGPELEGRDVVRGVAGPRAARERVPGLVSLAWTSSSRLDSRRASPSSARPPSQAEPGPAVPGDDPVVEGEPEERAGPGRRPRSTAAARGRARGRSRGSRPGRRGRAGRRPDDDGPVEPADEPSRDRERVRPGGRALEDRDRIGGEVGPPRVATRPGALEQGEAGQVAERLGHVDGPRGGEAVGEAPQAERGARSGRGDHGAMIRRDRPRPADEGRWRGPDDSRPATRERGDGAPPVQATATGAGFSIGTPMRLPYSVQLPS